MSGKEVTYTPLRLEGNQIRRVCRPLGRGRVEEEGETLAPPPLPRDQSPCRISCLPHRRPTHVGGNDLGQGLLTTRGLFGVAEQEVDLDALRSFKENVITELVPLIGPRCKFLRGWRAWKELGAPAPSALPASGPAESLEGIVGASPACSPPPPLSDSLQVAPPKRSLNPATTASPSPSAPSTSRRGTAEEVSGACTTVALYLVTTLGA